MQFARDVIVLPEGPYEGEKWRPEFQPYAYHVLHLMDTLGFRKFRGTGCVQSGKTFNFNIINLAWHIRERKENCIFGIPEMDMAESVWKEKIEPVFNSSPELRWLLPKRGRGSKGGFGTLIQFRNGTVLKFMGGSGKDSRRSSFTAPVIIKTEVDRYDTATQASRETSAVEQMEARTESFDDFMFSYEECTVTTEDGRIWIEVNAGTGTELYTQCPSCRAWQLPGRDDLHGVDDCKDVLQAADEGRFACQHCGIVWEESDRDAMVQVDRLVPVHRGQTIRAGDDGAALIEGDLPRTDKLSIRWNAFLNKFWKTATIAKAEWNALYAKDPEAIDLKRRQFAWATPAEPKEFDLVPLTLGDIYHRFSDWGIGKVPDNTLWVTRGVDPSKRKLDVVTRAWSTEDKVTWLGRAIDIATVPVNWEQLGVREALLAALTSLRTDKSVYFDANGKQYPVALTLLDGGWMEEVMWSFLLDLHERGIKGWLLSLGRGQSEPPGKGSYVEPRTINPTDGPIYWNGENCHIRKGKHGLPFVMKNSDEWKSFIHDGYATPPGKNGALTHFNAVTGEEKMIIRQYLKELLSEKRRRVKVPRRGVVDVWFHENSVPNHQFDADSDCCVAANILGVRIATRERPTATAKPEDPPASITMPDGSPLFSNS